MKLLNARMRIPADTPGFVNQFGLEVVFTLDYNYRNSLDTVIITIEYGNGSDIFKTTTTFHFPFGSQTADVFKLEESGYTGNEYSFRVEFRDPPGPLPPARYRELVGLFEDGIGAMCELGGSNILIFNHAGNRYAWFNGNRGAVLGIFYLHDENGPLSGRDPSRFEATKRVSDFAAIEAAVLWDNSTGGERVLYLYEKSPNQRYEWFKFSHIAATGNTLPDSDFGYFNHAGWRQNTGTYYWSRVAPRNSYYASLHPFSRYYYTAAVIAGSGPKFQIFEDPGYRYAIYRSDTDEWGPIMHNNEFYPHLGGLFDQVGASTRITFSNLGIRHLYVDIEGKQLLELTPGNPGAKAGPWPLY